MHLSSLSSLVSLSTFVLLAGCAGVPEDETVSGEAMITEAQVPELAKVEAIRFAAGAGLPAQQIEWPVKREAILKAMKKVSGGPVVGACGIPTVHFELLDAEGATIGRGSHRCARGNLTFGEKEIPLLVDVAALKAQRQLPLVPSDATFSVLHGPAGIETITAVEGLITVDHERIEKIAEGGQ